MKTLIRAACVAVLLALTLATMPAGQAKGPTDVVVSGPGIDDVHLVFTHRTDDVDAGTLGRASRLHDIWNHGRLGPAPDLSESALGPRFVLTWTAGEPGDGEDVVLQHAYPFAEGGGWIQVLPGQELWNTPVATGWARAPRIHGELVALGAVADLPAPVAATPEPDPASGGSGEPGDAAGTAPVERPSGPAYDVVLTVGILAVLVLAAGLLVARRRRLSR